MRCFRLKIDLPSSCWTVDSISGVHVLGAAIAFNLPIDDLAKTINPFGANAPVLVRGLATKHECRLFGIVKFTCLK